MPENILAKLLKITQVSYWMLVLHEIYHLVYSNPNLNPSGNSEIPFQDLLDLHVPASPLRVLKYGPR